MAGIVQVSSLVGLQSLGRLTAVMQTLLNTTVLCSSTVSDYSLQASYLVLA